MNSIWPQPWGSSPQRQILGDPMGAWRESELYDVVDLNDPDLRYVVDSIELMRRAHVDMTDPEMLRIAVEAGHRKAVAVRDDSVLLGYAGEDREWREAEKHDPAAVLPGWCGTARVYYMRLGNRCKIGWSGNVKKRMTDIQPEELLATERGGPKLEAERHAQFDALRTSGEWFRFESPLVEHVARLRENVTRG